MEKSVGIKTTGADTYVAAFTAAEQADGKERLVQIIAITAGKVNATMGGSTRNVTTNDTLDLTTISGNISISDESYFACYLRHSRSDGSCLVTPLLCDNNGVVMGCLDSKVSRVMLPVASGIYYVSNCLSWHIVETGAWKIYTHVTDLSPSNSVELWSYTF